MEKKDPKKGTGKKPKGLGRRLYTDENPKDTVSIKFALRLTQEKQLRKCEKLKNLLREKFKFLLSENKEQK